MSYNKLHIMLDVSTNTVKNYINYLENSYLLFTVPKYDYSVRKQVYSRKKAYVIDTGMIHLVSFKFSREHGKILENIVFVELRRRGKEIYYHRDRYECDFIISENKMVTGAIQVTVSLKENKKREYGGLVEALERYNLDEGLVLTDDDQFDETFNGKLIKVRPVWKWLLES